MYADFEQAARDFEQGINSGLGEGYDNEEGDLWMDDADSSVEDEEVELPPAETIYHPQINGASNANSRILRLKI